MVLQHYANSLHICDGKRVISWLISARSDVDFVTAGSTLVPSTRWNRDARISGCTVYNPGVGSGVQA